MSKFCAAWKNFLKNKIEEHLTYSNILSVYLVQRIKSTTLVGCVLSKKWT
jgi:hypothetical protein